MRTSPAKSELGMTVLKNALADIEQEKGAASQQEAGDAALETPTKAPAKLSRAQLKALRKTLGPEYGEATPGFGQTKKRRLIGN